METIPTYLPATDCMKCRKSLEETGGRRIQMSPVQGVYFTNHKALGNQKKNSKIYEVLPSIPLYLVTYGVEEPVAQNALDQAKEEYHPWLCQICAGRICNLCGQPFKITPACELLNDDGKTTHMMIIPAQPTCSNPDCERFGGDK